MDVRDGQDGVLKPREVAILFFERRNLAVRIHSLRIDAEGNVVGAPTGYRRFFMEEVSRSLWKQGGELSQTERRLLGRKDLCRR